MIKSTKQKKNCKNDKSLGQSQVVNVTERQDHQG